MFAVIKNKSALIFAILVGLVFFWISAYRNSGPTVNLDELQHTPFNKVATDVKWLDQKFKRALTFKVLFTEKFTASDFDRIPFRKVEDSKEKERILSNIRNLYNKHQLHLAEVDVYCGASGDFWMEIVIVNGELFITAERF